MAEYYSDLHGKCSELIASLSGQRMDEPLQQKWICRLNPSSRLTFVNDSCCRRFCLKPTDLFGAQGLPFILEEDLPVLRSALSQFNPRRPAARVELRLVLPEGIIEKRTWMANAVFEEDGLLKEFWLITENPLVAPAIENPSRSIIENRYSKLDARNGAFALFELISIEPGYFPQFRLIDANLAFEELKGISIDTLLGRRLSEILPGLESDWLDMLKRIAFQGEGAKFKYFFRGGRKYLEIIAYRSSPKQIALRIADSAMPASSEEAMCLSEDSFKAIVDGAAEGIVIAYGFADSCVFANRRAGQLSGYDVEELLQIAPARFLLEAQQPQLEPDANRRLHVELNEDGAETELIRKDGDIWPIDACASKLCWQGRPAKMIVFREAPCRKNKLIFPIHGDEFDKSGHRQYTHRLETTSRMLAQKQEELDRYKANLERVNRELVHTNKALSVMARSIDRKSQQMVQQFTHAVTSKILPALEVLESVDLPEKNRIQIDVIRSHLEELTSDTPTSSGGMAALSKTELRVAILIRNGYKTLEISRLLHLSDLTVKTHRRNIRKKLQIRHSKINLATYLKMKLAKSKFLFNSKSKDRLDKTGSMTP
jgi:PAS domain S-box-containing protein